MTQEKSKALDDLIADAYQKGHGISKICMEKGVGKARVRRVLSERGIAVRKREEGRKLALSQGRGGFGQYNKGRP